MKTEGDKILQQNVTVCVSCSLFIHIGLLVKLLYTNELLLIVCYTILGIVDFIYLGVSGYNLTNIVFLSEDLLNINKQCRP